MKMNNKGFSLTELIICVALLGIIGAAVLGFMYSGARAYSSVYTTVNLQAQSQVALTQVRQRLMDCNGSVSFEETDSGATLLAISSTVDEDGSAALQTHAFRFVKEDGVLYYKLFSGSSAGSGVEGWEPVAADLTAFSYTRDRNAVTVTLSFDRRGKTYTGTEVVALRNSPKTGGSTT